MEDFTTNNEESQTYSVQLRLRRVTYEDAYVSVLIDEKVMQEQEDGTGRIDFEKFVAEAVRISATSDVDWQVESTQTDVHPTQNESPPHRGIVDSLDLLNEQ